MAEPSELAELPDQLPRGLARPDRAALLVLGVATISLVSSIKDFIEARRMVRFVEAQAQLASQQAQRAGISSPTEQGVEGGADDRDVGPDEAPNGEATGPSLGSAPLPPLDGPAAGD